MKILATAAWLASLGIAGIDNTVPITLSHKITDIPTTREKFFGLVEDFRHWKEWSRHEDPAFAMRRLYSGAPHGKGAVYEWDGNGDAGSGRATISESAAPNAVVVEIDLVRPVPGHLTLKFAFEKTGDKASVALSTSGPTTLVQAVYGMFFGVEKLFGDSPVSVLSCAAQDWKGWCHIMRRKAAHDA